MKLLFLSCLVCSVIFGFSQTKRIHSGDSIWIASEREAIFKELIPFRDSVYLFVKIISSHIEESSISNREMLEKSKEELIGFRTRLNLEIRDVSLTSQNHWTRKTIKRMRASILATRHEYKRLRAKLVVNGNEFTIQ